MRGDEEAEEMNAQAYRRCDLCGRMIPVGEANSDAPAFVCSVCAWKKEARA